MSERENTKWGRAVRDATFNGGNHKFLAVKVPRQCPLVLVVKLVEEKVRR
jgi:hypothetical protein